MMMMMPLNSDDEMRWGENIIISSYTFYHLNTTFYEHTIIIIIIFIIIIVITISWEVVVCYLSVCLSIYLSIFLSIYLQYLSNLPSSYQCLLNSGQHILFVMLNDVLTSSITILNQNWYKIKMIYNECIQHRGSSLRPFK